jgi:hypothetical protein
MADTVLCIGLPQALFHVKVCDNQMHRKNVLSRIGISSKRQITRRRSSKQQKHKTAEGQNSRWTKQQMDKTADGQNSRWTKQQMDKTAEGQVA